MPATYQSLIEALSTGIPGALESVDQGSGARPKEFGGRVHQTASFDETQILTDCVVASADGTTLTPYEDTALTAGEEVNKLAFNVAMGRDSVGIHYPSDAEAGMTLGEDVAIAMSQDLVQI